MKLRLVVFCAILVSGATSHAATLCSGTSSPVTIDLTDGVRTAASTERIAYSSEFVLRNYINNGGFEKTDLQGGMSDGPGSDLWAGDQRRGLSDSWTTQGGLFVGYTMAASPWSKGTNLPMGKYCAYVQHDGYLEQEVLADVSGEYELSFVSAARVSMDMGHRVKVIVDSSEEVLSVVSENAVAIRHSARMFLSKGAHTIRFAGVRGDSDRDQATLIDDVSLRLDSNPSVEIAANDIMLAEVQGSGVYDWTPTRNGTYTLTHVVKVDGVQVGETLSATFVVEGLNPENPVITPASGTIFDSSLTVSMSCASEGATIHYTTDGGEPTMESPVYKRFRVSGRTTVKARAFYENGEGSDVVTAEYALGRCANPVIDAVDSFMGKRRKVTISCATGDATIRYTLDGSEPNSHATKYVAPFDVTDSCTIKARAFKSEWFESETASHAVTRVRGIGDSVALPDQAFMTSGAAGWIDDSGVAMRSGAISENQRSVLSTTFVGKGQLSFVWRTSCEEDEEAHDWDHVSCKIDGREIARQDGESEWVTITCDLTADRSHKVEWIYTKDDAESGGEDCAWVKDIVWMPELTQTTEVRIPFAWLKERYPALDNYYFDYEDQANEIAANGGNAVWECYVLGLEPTEADERFVASIELVEGEPKVTWSPDLGGDRVYKILGSTDLETWELVGEGRMCDYNFFKVAVEMK